MGKVKRPLSGLMHTMRPLARRTMGFVRHVCTANCCPEATLSAFDMVLATRAR